jgi:hypothetical protein
MRRALLYILFPVLAVPIGAVEVPCGTWIELRASSVDDWHFDHWSDGNTDAVRQVEVLGDAHYVAYFAPNCGDYPALPVVALYDWLILLDVRSINAKGYYFGEEAVTWYRVRGAPDKLTDGASADDERVGIGYSLTIDQSFLGTGDYYASVDVSSSPSGVLCTDLMRSFIVHYASTAAYAPPLLEPTMVRAHEPQRLLHLNPDQPTKVTIYDIAGHCLQTLSADGVERMSLQAEGVAGCYQVVVQNGEQRTVLRYIVVN